MRHADCLTYPRSSNSSRSHSYLWPLARAELPLLIRTRYLHSPSLSLRRSSQPRSTYASTAPVAPAPYCTPSYQVGEPSGPARTHTQGKFVISLYLPLGEPWMASVQIGTETCTATVVHSPIPLTSSRKVYMKTSPLVPDRFASILPYTVLFFHQGQPFHHYIPGNPITIIRLS